MDLERLTVPKSLELTAALLLVLYATVGIAYLKDVDGYLRFFDHKLVRILSVAVTCAVSYVNPKLGILLAISLFRTVDIIAERFTVIEVDSSKPPEALIGTDGALHKLEQPGKFPDHDARIDLTTYLGEAGDYVDRVTSDLMGLRHSAGDIDPNDSVDRQFTLTMAAPPGEPVPISAPATDPALTDLVPEPPVDMPMISAESADIIGGIAPGAPGAF